MAIQSAVELARCLRTSRTARPSSRTRDFAAASSNPHHQARGPNQQSQSRWADSAAAPRRDHADGGEAGQAGEPAWQYNYHIDWAAPVTAPDTDLARPDLAAARRFSRLRR